jgi:hypothetical protein
MNWSKIRVRDLSTRAIDETSRDIDWSEGWGTTWEEVNPTSEMSVAQLRGKLKDIGADFGPDDDAATLRETLEYNGSPDDYIPIVNAYYPLPGFRGDPERTQLALEGAYLSVALVKLYDGDGGEDYALALTGCGMDLSWDIAAAHIVCGYLPPAWLRLPSMSGDKFDAKHRTIIAALRRTAQIRIRRSRYDLQDLRSVARNLKERGK